MASAARILSLTEGHVNRAQGRGKAISLSLLHLSEGSSTAPALPKGRQDVSQLADPCIVLPPSCPTACWKTRSKSTCSEWLGFGISPRRTGPAAWGWQQRSFHLVWRRRKRRRRWEAGADAGVPASHPSTKSWL